MVGLDSEGEPHVYELTPDGDCVEYVGYAIGNQSQTAKTYLENNMKEFEGADLKTLVKHALTAIKSGYRDKKEEMSEKNIEVSVINEKGLFQSLTEDEVAQHLRGVLEAPAMEIE